MKLLTILRKNFRLLFRSKSSAFVVFIGPLLIIALILITFSFSPNVALSVGLSNADQAGTGSFTDSLTSGGYETVTYFDLAQCINDVKLGTINLCLDFPDEFGSTDGTTKQVEFYIDQSRINIVESIIFAISTNIDTKSEEITLSKTKNILNSIGASIDTILDEQGASTASIDGGIRSGTASITSSSDKISDSVEGVSIDATLMITQITELREKTEELKGETEDLISAADSASCCGSALSGINEIFEDDNELVEENLVLLETAINGLGDANEALDLSDKESALIQEKVATVSSLIADMRVSLESINGEALSIKDLSKESIENPFEIKVNEVVANSNRSLFIFPYYIMLMVLFVGMMLSSNLVVMEKESLAFFRNFSSPTSEGMHIFARFLSNFIIVAGQLSVVLLSVFYFIKIPILNNVFVSLVILLMSMTFFIFLGYLLGYTFKTQEGITIGFISLGGIFAFLSNLILPVESFPIFAQKVLLFNPYMLCSELLKKSILFGASFGTLKVELLLLLAYTIIVVILGFTLQRLSFNRFFINSKTRNAMRRPHITKDKYFKLEDETFLKTLEDLVKALRKMNQEDLNTYVSPKNNEFSIWVLDAFKNKKLARALRKAPGRESMIDILEYFLSQKTVAREPLMTKRWFKLTLAITAGVIVLAMIITIIFLIF